MVSVTDALETQIDIAAVKRGLARMPEVMVKHLKDGTARVLLGYRKDFFAHSKAKIKAGAKGLKSPRFWPVVVNGTTIDSLLGEIFTESKAAGIMETGGTIRGKGKMLALPLSGAKVSTGSRRRAGFTSPAAAVARGHQFVARKSRTGRIVLYEKKPKGMRGRPVFVLVPSVTLRPTLGFFKEWNSPPAMAARVRRLNISIGRAIIEIFGPDSTRGPT